MSKLIVVVIDIILMICSLQMTNVHSEYESRLLSSLQRSGQGNNGFDNTQIQSDNHNRNLLMNYKGEYVHEAYKGMNEEDADNAYVRDLERAKDKDYGKFKNNLERIQNERLQETQNKQTQKAQQYQSQSYYQGRSYYDY